MSIYQIDDLIVDLDQQTVVRDGERVELTELNFRMLACLVNHAPHPVNPRALAQEVWGTGHVTGETIAQRIRLLRQALGDDGQTARYVRTRRGRGYAVTTVAAVPAARAWRWDRWATVGAMGLTVLVLVAVVGRIGIRSQPEPTAITAPLPDLLVQRARQQMRLHQQGPTEKAIALLREARAINPEHSEARLALSFALSTFGTKFASDPVASISEAEALARETLKSDIGNSNGWCALGYALDAQGKMTEALASYERAIALNPENRAALSSAAYLHGIQGSLFRALDMDAKGMAQGNYSKYADIQVAQVLELLGYAAAGQWYARAQQLDPGQAVVTSEVARSRLRQGDPTGALVVLDQSIEADNPRLQELRGRAQLALGDIEAAQQSLEQAGARGKLTLAALTALHYQTPAQESLHEAEQVLLKGDGWPGLRVQLAELRAAAGQYDVALQFLAQAIDLGWRDIAAIEQSPFLSPLLVTEQWQQMRRRIMQALAVQRELIESHHDTAMLLAIR